MIVTCMIQLGFFLSCRLFLCLLFPPSLNTNFPRLQSITHLFFPRTFFNPNCQTPHPVLQPRLPLASHLLHLLDTSFPHLLSITHLFPLIFIASHLPHTRCYGRTISTCSGVQINFLFHLVVMFLLRLP